MTTYSTPESYDIVASDQGYYRYPTIFKDHVVFVSEDDLWEVPLAGGYARRLTAAMGTITNPAFSPNGKYLAFTSTEEGAPEVFVMDAKGGPARQLTFNGAQSTVVGWSRDGQHIIFRSNFREPFNRAYVLYQVSVHGGEPTRLSFGPAHSLAFQPDGPGLVIARHTDDIARWKRYKGGTAGVLWIDIDGAGQWTRLLPNIISGLCRPMWIGERIYFISDFEGYGEIYSCLPGGEDLTCHTKHSGFYARFAQTDGKNIIYTCGGDLYRLSTDDHTIIKIDINYASPRSQLKRKFVSADHYLDDFTLHPKGHSLAVSSRGKLFNFGNWEGAVRHTGVEQGVRYRLARYLLDGNRIVVISDESGEEQLEIHYANGSRRPEKIQLDDFDLGRPLELLVSPVSDEIIVSNHRHEIIHIDLIKYNAKIIDRSQYQRIAGMHWSPDGQWVAYGYFQNFSTSLIKIANLQTGDTHEVTTGEFQDINPYFDPKGRYLYFLSYRHFDPVYDQMFFELSFPRGMKPCVITLRDDIESLFVEKPRPLDGDDGDDDDEIANDDGNDNEPGNEHNNSGNTDDEPTNDENDDNIAGADGEQECSQEDDILVVDIDFETIKFRTQVFPVRDANYGDIAATEDRVFWTIFPIEGSLGHDDADEGSGLLMYYSLKNLKEKPFASQIHTFEIGPDGKTMALLNNNGLQVISAQGEGSQQSDDDELTPCRESGYIDLDRISLSVVPQLEWYQMLRESWRLMRDHFWRPDMGGLDWNNIWERYKPLIGRVLTRNEFSDLVWIMQGELGTSHAYEMGGDYAIPPQYRPGLLGIEVTWDESWNFTPVAPTNPDDDNIENSSDQPPASSEQNLDLGAYRITRIIKGDTWSMHETSPLSRPGLGIHEGDAIVAINGQRCASHISIEQRLVNQFAKDVELTISNQKSPHQLRQATVKTLISETPARYREWVNKNRQKVHAATDGKIGYVHIPDMGPRGFSEFHRYYLAENSRQGLIVDVRYNGGGHVSQLILEKLSRKRLGYDISRWGKPVPYPQESIHGPLVALTNEHAGSDGDIFSHCFKLMNLGPLLGKRTWGGVVGIWPRHALVDGSITTQPEFSFWFQDVGFSVENYGTEPDVEIELPPHAYQHDEDPQLEASIATALDLLKTMKPELPDFSF